MTRNTKAKENILAFIKKSPSAVSHSEINLALGNLCDRVTIYRVLERLVNEKKIHKIVNTDGVINYASCKTCHDVHHHDHIHFSCQSCKSITCLEDCNLSFKIPNNYQINEMYFTISGICQNCINI